MKRQAEPRSRHYSPTTIKAAQRAVASYLATVEVQVELDDQGREVGEVEVARTGPLPSGIARALLIVFEDAKEPRRGRACALAIARLAVGAVLTLVLCACGGGSTSTVDACHENSDCATGLVCALGACREPCTTSADCAAGWTCEAMACAPPASSASSTSDAGEGGASVSGAICCTPDDPTKKAMPCHGSVGGFMDSWYCGVVTIPASGSFSAPLCTAAECLATGGACTYLSPLSVAEPGTVTICPPSCTVTDGFAVCP
jgi:hypothetical protein